MSDKLLTFLLTSILEEFKTQAEKDPFLVWKDYEEYKDKLIFIPYITRDDHSKEIHAKMIAYKDGNMTEGGFCLISILQGTS